MSAVRSHWIPHAREDGEVIGWIDMDTRAPELIPIDRLGRALVPVDDWQTAEEVLEERGLRFLMNKFEYQGRSVRIRQLYDDHIIVTTALSDAVGDVGDEFVIAFPAGPELIENPGS